MRGLCPDNHKTSQLFTVISVSKQEADYFEKRLEARCLQAQDQRKLATEGMKSGENPKLAPSDS